MDVRHVIDEYRWTPLQYLVICLCFFLNMLDGMDVLAIALAAPVLAREWQINPDTLGFVFSAALVGMALGAILIAPKADVWGRRRLVIICMTVIAVGMLLTPLAKMVPQLVVLRFLTGLGVGGMVASMATMSAEFSPKRTRNLAVTFVQAGYPVGAAVLGLIGAKLIPAFGWNSVFILAGLLTTLSIPIVAILLPESPEFLLQKQPKGSLEKLNKILRKMGHPRMTELPPIAGSAQANRTGVTALFSKEYRTTTVLLWVGFFMAFGTLYFLLNWIPELATNTGLTLEFAIYSGAVLNVGAFFGMVTLGFLADRIGLKRVIVAWLILAALVMVLFGNFQTSVAILLALCVIGFFMEGGFIGIYAAAAQVYPTLIRNTGVGWAIGAGRTGAILSPYIAGVLVREGMSMVSLFKIFSAPLLVGAAAIGMMKAKQMVISTNSTPASDPAVKSSRAKD